MLYLRYIIKTKKKMATASLKIRLGYNQVLDLIRQLSDEDKMKLSRELKAETRKIKLQHLLEVFKNDEISLSDIDAEVESVRKERYENR